MKDIREISIEEEIDKQGEKIEQEVLNDERIRDVKIPPELDAKLKARIAEIEAQTERDNEAKAKKTTKFPKKKKIWIALVAVLVLLLGIGTTSVGSKSYLKEMWDKRFGNNDVDIMSVADMESSETKEVDKASVYKEIKEKIGIYPVRIKDLPYGMKLNGYEINEDSGIASVFYSYQDQIIQYTIYIKNADSSLGVHSADNITEEFIVDNEEQSISVEGYQVDDTNQVRYCANFAYNDINYQLNGVVKKEIFIEILKSLKYF